MRSPLLQKLSRRKTGWKPKPLLDEEGKIFRNKCMVGNGTLSRLVEINEKDPAVDKRLEHEVIKLIKQLEEKDENFIKKESLIFSVIAMASISQAQHFVGFLHKDGKLELNRFINQTEKVVKRIQKDAIDVGGEQMETMFDSLEDISHKVFQHLSYSIEQGKVVEFLNCIEEFSNAEKPVKKKKAKKK